VALEKACAIALYPHHIEHLAPLCELLGMPMVVVDQSLARLARAHYPPEFELQVRDNEDLLDTINLQSFGTFICGLRHSFQVVFHSHILWPHERTLLDQCGLSTVAVPHGFSEKVQDWAALSAESADINLFYGQLCIDQIAALGAADKIGPYLLIGDLRYQYYLRHRQFFQRWFDDTIGWQLQGGRRILYCPTWMDGIGSSSMFDAIEHVIQSLPADAELIVKLHPHADHREHAARTDELVERTRRRRVVFARNVPLTFPMLARASALLCDMSAIAYDALVFDRPLIFLNQNSGTERDPRDSRLFSTGVVVPHSDYHQLRPILERALAEPAAEYWPAKQALFHALHSPGVPPVELESRLRALLGVPRRELVVDS
jgi:teichoic acid glycerol-phosphate primase